MSQSRNVTELTEEIKVLNNKINELEEIIALMPGHVYWTDKTGRYLGCNNLLAKNTGLNSRVDIVGMTDEDVSKKLNWSGEIVNKFKSENLYVMKTGKMIKDIENSEAKTIGGKPLCLLTTKAPLKSLNNEITGVIGISIDITERKELEEKLKEANKAKIALMSITDLKLRNILNSTFNGIELIRRGSLSAEQKEFLEMIEESNRGLLPLMDYLVDFVGLETNTLEVYHYSVDLKMVCQELIHAREVKAFKRGVQDIILDYPDNLPVYIESDEQRIKKIIGTLLDNAVRFTSSGQIILRVEEKKRTEGEINLKISVIDEGKGLTKKEQARVFNLFEQLPIEKTEDYVKAGVKLSIMKKIIEMMGGEVGVKSEEGKGAEFWFSLSTPVTRQPLNRGNSTPWWERYRKEVRVLIVDNHKERRELLYQTLASPRNAMTDEKEAIKQLETAEKQGKPFDLIVVDGDIKNLKAFINKVRDNALSHGLIAVMVRPEEESAILGKYLDPKIVALHKPTIPVEFAESLKKIWGEHRNRSPQILLIEDEASCQLAEKVFLEQLGCIVTIAVDGESALELVQKEKYDAILVDIGLPGLSGVEVMNKIREMKGEEAPPMIVVTAHNRDDDSDAFGEAGAYDVLFKPVSLDALKHALHEAITIYEDEMRDW